MSEQAHTRAMVRRALSGAFVAVLSGALVAGISGSAGAAKTKHRAHDHAVIPSLVYHFDNGTSDGWRVDYGPATLALTSSPTYIGAHALSVTLTKKGNPGIMSPNFGTGLNSGSVLTLHLHEQALDSFRVQPYAMDQNWNAHFGAATRLSPGAWKTVSFTVPRLTGSARYVGFEVENGAGIRHSVVIGEAQIFPSARTTAGSGTPGNTGAAGNTGSGATTTLPSTTTTLTSPPVSGSVTPNGPLGTWNLKFDDEFNGSALDTSLWSPDWFQDGGSMNNTATHAANVSVSNGVLSLNLASSSNGALVSTNPNGGATKGFQFTYGYAEARIRFTGGGSTINNWPAFWTDGQSWPADGEIDIAEGLGTLTTNYHNPAGAFNSNTIPGTWANGWHTYGVDWEPGSITIYWDGEVVHTLTSATTSITSSPQYLILNVGSGEGPTVTGTSMQVDYVRVWQH